MSGLVRPGHREVRLSPASLATVGENSELARFPELILSLEEPRSESHRHSTRDQKQEPSATFIRSSSALV